MTAHAAAPLPARRVPAPDACTRMKRPKLREAVWEVTEVDPGRSVTWVSRMPGLVYTARHVVTPAADGSSVLLSVDNRESRVGGRADDQAVPGDRGRRVDAPVREVSPNIRSAG